MLDGAEAPAELRPRPRTWQPGLTLFAVHLATDANLTYDTRTVRWPRSPAESARRPGLYAQLDAFARGETYAVDPWVLIVCSTVVDPDRAPGGQGVSKLLTFAPRDLAQGPGTASATGSPRRSSSGRPSACPGSGPSTCWRCAGRRRPTSRRATGTTSAAPATAGSSGCRRARCWSAGRRTGCRSRGSTRPAPPRTPAARSPGGPGGTPPAPAHRPRHRPGDRHGRRRLIRVRARRRFRSPAWDAPARADFEARLARARARNRQQYLRIEGLALRAAAVGDAARRLLERAADRPDGHRVETSSASETLDDLAFERGDRHTAQQLYYRILAQNPTSSGTASSIEISLAELLLDAGSPAAGTGALRCSTPGSTASC